MPEASTFGIFVAAALALLLVPGPAVFYIIARSVEGVRTAGLVSVLGVEIGTLSCTRPSPRRDSPRFWLPQQPLSRS